MTVSPVINRYGYASQEARARVERAVAELPVDVIVRRSSAPAPWTWMRGLVGQPS